MRLPFCLSGCLSLCLPVSLPAYLCICSCVFSWERVWKKTQKVLSSNCNQSEGYVFALKSRWYNQIHIRRIPIGLRTHILCAKSVCLSPLLSTAPFKHFLRKRKSLSEVGIIIAESLEEVSTGGLRRHGIHSLRSCSHLQPPLCPRVGTNR